MKMNPILLESSSKDLENTKVSFLLDDLTMLEYDTFLIYVPIRIRIRLKRMLSPKRERINTRLIKIKRKWSTINKTKKSICKG